MNTTTLSQAEIAITDRYWKMLNSLSNKVKLCLATRLTSSVIEATPETQHADIKGNFSIIDKFYGAWQGEESADEIISTIRENYTSKAPIKM